MDRGEGERGFRQHQRDGIIQPVVTEHSLLGQEVITPGGEINLETDSSSARRLAAPGNVRRLAAPGNVRRLAAPSSSPA